MSLKILRDNFFMLQGYLGTGTAVKATALDAFSKAMSTTTGKIIAGVGAFTAMSAILDTLADKYNLTYDAAMKNTEASVQNVQSTQSEIDSLKSQADEARTTLTSLADAYNIEITGAETIDDLIEKISSADLSLEDEIQVSNIAAQNDQLERQLNLKEKLLTTQQKEAAANAVDTLERGEKSVAQEVSQDVPDGRRLHADQIGNVNVVDAVKDNVKAISEYEEKIKELETTQYGFKPGSDKWDEAQEDIDAYNEAIDTLMSDVDTKVPELESLLQAFSADGVGGSALEGYEKQFKQVQDALNSVNNMDLSPAEQKLQAVKDFFEGTDGNSFIKDEMLEIAKSGGDVSKALQQMGVDIYDLGMDAETVNRYFQEMASSAQEAADAVNSVDGSFEGVQAAFESANQGAEWDAMATNLASAKELIEQGRVGTDDFQTVAQWMSYSKIDEDQYKYDADAYVAAWENAYAQVSRWFDSENPLQSMWNFAEDLESKGLATITKDANGSLAEIIPTFDNTAEAAKNFGVSVDAVESAMHKLEEYGFEFDDIMFSGEGLSRYQSALDNIRSVYDSMEAGDSKNRLGRMIEGWEAEYSKYEADLSTLTEDQIVHIEFEYDLATIQQQIDQLQAQAEEGGDTNTWAELNAGKKSYRETAEEGLGLNQEGIQIPVEYTTTEDTISALQSQLIGIEDEETKIQVQAEISNLYDLQNDLINSFDESGLSWDEFLQTDEAKTAIGNLASESEDAKKTVADLLGMDVEDLEVKVDADTSEAENKLKGIAANDGKHIVMDVDASTEQIQAQIDNLQEGQTLTFQAKVDDVDSVINAVKDEEGHITYTATVDGVEQKISPILNKDGTVSYTLGEVPTVLPDASQTVERNPDDSKVRVNPSAVDQTAVRKPDNSGVMSSPPSVTQTVTRVISTVVGAVKSVGSSIAGIGGFNGTAHVNGTTRRGKAFVSGNWGVPRTERALVGELGQETVVTPDGHYQTVGDNGAEFVNIRKGSIIFNHRQTEELFKNGYVTSGGGRARVIGGAYAFGSAYATGGRLPIPGSSGYGSSSSHKSSGNSSSNNASKAATSAANAASSAANSAAKAADEFKEKFDEVEIWLDRFDRTLNNLTDSIETYSYDLSKQSSVSDQAMNHIRNNLSTLQSAYNRYIQEANSVGLDESWAAKVRNGAINIETITDEDLKEKIDEYQDYFEKALDVQDTIAEMQKELLDLAVEKLENIDQYYENREDYDDNFGYLTSIEQLSTSLDEYRKELQKQIDNGIIKEFSNEFYDAMETISKREQDLFEAMLKKYQDIVDNLDRISTTLDNSLSLKEARDEPITEEDYQRPMEVANEQIDSLFEKRQKLLEQQAIYDVGSELYDDIAEQIADIDDDIFGLLEDIEDLKDKIWEVRWQPFFDGQEALENLRDETEDFRDLLHDDAFVGEFGGLTSEGLTNLALISQSMNSAKQEIRNYQEALVKLDQDLKAGNISTSEYEEQQKDFISQISDSVGVVEDYRNEITDLWQEMLEKENEVIQDSIDKHKELLQAKKDNDDYSRNVRDQTKEINAIQAQISALSGVNNESAKAELKRLQQELNEQQQSLKDMQSDREYDIRQQGFDYLSEDLDNQLEDTLNSVKYNAQKQEQVISEMLNNVVNNYQTAYDKINQIIANTGFTPSGDFQQNIDNIGSQPGAQGQIDASNTIAPNYTPDDFVGGINTGQIQTDKDQSKNDAIQEEIEKEPNIDNRPVALIELKPTSLTLQEGQSGSISAHVRPTDAANKTLSWTSSNTSVATVSGGTVKAVKPGSATITCSATDGSGKTATASVTVTKKPDPPKPAPSGGDGVLRVGDRVTFTGQYYYSSWGVKPAGSLYSGVPNGVIVDSYSASKYGGSARFTGGYDVHIRSADGRYGDLGWVSIGQLSGYKDGTLGVTHNQLAKVNEAGREMIIRAGGSQIAHLQYGDAVLPHNLSENMFTLSSNTHAIMNNLARSTPDGSQSEVVINNNYESLLTVNGDIDKDTFPGVKRMCEQAYQYTSKKMYQDAGLMGIKKRL